MMPEAPWRSRNPFSALSALATGTFGGARGVAGEPPR